VFLALNATGTFCAILNIFNMPKILIQLHECVLWFNRFPDGLSQSSVMQTPTPPRGSRDLPVLGSSSRAELALGSMLDPLLMYTGPFYFFMQVQQNPWVLYSKPLSPRIKTTGASPFSSVEISCDRGLEPSAQLKGAIWSSGTSMLREHSPFQHSNLLEWLPDEFGHKVTLTGWV
jgi:hypothetical protein